MKFWELVSAFRSEKDILSEVLQNPQWEMYYKYFLNLESIITKQDRLILDKTVPFDLAYEICWKSKLRFYLSYKESPQIIYHLKQDPQEDFQQIFASDILIRYGGNVIEEILEYGSAKVDLRQIGDRIEVIECFNMSQIGMLAVLRTENAPLQNNDILKSAENSLEWLVINEPVMFVDPYSAYLRKAQNKEQGIIEYRIQPINHNNKPRIQELLERKMR